MAKMKLFERYRCTSLWRWYCSAALSALWGGTSRRWWLERGGWFGNGLVLLSTFAGPPQAAAALADSRQIKA